MNEEVEEEVVGSVVKDCCGRSVPHTLETPLTVGLGGIGWAGCSGFS